MEGAPEMAVEWRQTQSRGNYTEGSKPKTRDLGCKILAVSLLAFSLTATYRPDFVIRVTHLKSRLVKPWLSRSTWVLGLVLAFRAFIYRPVAVWLVGRLAYPLRGNRFDIGSLHFFERTIRETDWQRRAEQVVIEACDGRQIYTYHLLPTGEPNGKIVAFSLGNSDLVRSLPTNYFADLRAQGYTIACYDPPQYDQTAGPRNPSTDYAALEALLQYLIHARGCAEEQIHLVGQSIGSGSVCEMLSHYRVHGYLCVPFAELEIIADRQLQERFGTWFGHTLHKWFLQGVMQDRFGYHNMQKIAEAARSLDGARSLTIIAGEHDPLMHDQPELLQQTWNAHVDGKPQCHYRLELGQGHQVNLLGILPECLRTSPDLSLASG